ncbi:hypothetical protein CONLIGDRAFT_690602 [Coniochaeta ligniaria NRRL 30616]|uniref:Cora-domain-containing protein n=1 Tax=Coniochaeta ligniaria NRRL 30616 TaxID=1408157 RepID=A0A1J7J707_9PEZI|nr:hypothetical protein CONLIGDRAFT_690602 [Coniochaeta ligniaria NRRL 30616]
MDEFLFSYHLERCDFPVEKTSYLEIFNYSEPNVHTFKKESLAMADDFGDFLLRKGMYAPPPVKDNATFQNGMRLVLQHRLQNEEAFSSHTISLAKDAYRSLVLEMQLPLQGIQTTSVVGPFFWYEYNPDPANPRLQLIFRKSDVKWGTRSRGFEMMLSYNFRTRITSGYLRGNKSDEKSDEKPDEIDDVLKLLQGCSSTASHPLLLPTLFLTTQLSTENDNGQREIRGRLRRLEKALVQRYMKPVMLGQTINETDEELLRKGPQLDTINGELADLHCTAMWKRPQAWQNVVRRIVEASEQFWSTAGEEAKTPELTKLHREICSTLQLFTVKLEGLESYTHVSLERLSLQRQVMDSIVSLRESTISTMLAAQQKRLAEVTRQDGASMKTLAFLGSLFLPGTFLASIFSMSFFDFGGDMNGSVSTSAWIYFVVSMPLTALIVGAWWKFDRHSNKANRQDWHDIEAGMDVITARAMRSVQSRTGTSTF